MNTERTRDLDPNYYVNADGELVKVPVFTEEFYNQCHGEDGKFCGDAVRGNLKIGSKEIKDPVGDIKRFGELFIGLPGQSSLKAHAFAKRSLGRYSLAELCRFHTQFEADAKNLKTARKTAYLGIATIPLNTNRLFIAASSVTRSSIVIGFTVWRGLAIKKQMDRIDATVNGRKEKSSSAGRTKAAKLGLDGTEAFADNATGLDRSLIEEIKKAQKQLDEGGVEKVGKPTKQELLDAQKYINDLRVDPEEGISQFIIDALKITVEEALRDMGKETNA